MISLNHSQVLKHTTTVVGIETFSSIEILNSQFQKHSQSFSSIETYNNSSWQVGYLFQQEHKPQAH